MKINKLLQLTPILLALSTSAFAIVADTATPEAHCNISQITNLEMLAADPAAKTYSGVATFSISCTPGAVVAISLRSANRDNEYRNIVSPITGLTTKYLLCLTPDCGKAWGEAAYGEDVYRTIFAPGMSEILVSVFGKTVGAVKSSRAEQLLDNIVINVEAS